MNKTLLSLLALPILLLSACTTTQRVTSIGPDGEAINKLVDDSFVVPVYLETDQFRLRMLTTGDAPRDWDAVMGSKERLRAMYGGWPGDDFTVEENRNDLRRHERESIHREAFVYTVVKLDESQTLGCVYITAPRDDKNDVRVVMWVRDSAFEKGLDPVLEQAVRGWIDERWQFENPLFVGRE